jgi:hypothetical protein
VIVHLMLCDHAQVADGKLFINGGGITRFYGAGLPPGTSIALLLLVPWERTNEKIDVLLDLLTEDGHPVTDSEGAGLGMSGQFEVGRPPGVEPGIPIDVPLVFTIGGVGLNPGRYTWRLSIDGQTAQAWQIGFSVAAA